MKILLGLVTGSLLLSSCVQGDESGGGGGGAADGWGEGGEGRACSINVHLTSFIEEETVSGFRGDNRGFSSNYDPQASGRVHQYYRLNYDGRGGWSISGQRSWSSPTSGWGCNRMATPSSSASISGNSVVSSVSAADPCTPAVFTPSLNLHLVYDVSVDDDGYVTFSGALKGDAYPNTESFVAEGDFGQTLANHDSEGGLLDLPDDENPSSADTLRGINLTVAMGSVCF